MASCSEKSANVLGKRTRLVDFETKQSDEKETTQGFADSLQEETVEELDKTHKEDAFRYKALFVANLSPQTGISDIIRFFKNVGKVVRVQLVVNHDGNQAGYAFVEFASLNEANKALQNKNRGYLHGSEISLDVVNSGITQFPPKYCIDQKVWYKEDFQRENYLVLEEEETKPKRGGKKYLQRESLPIEEYETHPDFVEKVLFVANLSHQTEISHLIDFFVNVGEVASVRLVVDGKGMHVGFGFVEFASSVEAKKALEKKNGEYLHDHMIFLDVAKIAPYPPRPRYNLAAKLCYEDYLRRVSHLMKEDKTKEGLDETPDFVEEKTLFLANLPSEIEPQHIISFFKFYGEVVHVRLMLNHKGQHVGCAFAEFASVNEAKKSLEKMNGEYLHGRQIFLDKAKKMAPPSKYEDYLEQKDRLRKGDEEVQGLDETPDFIESGAARRKTVFVVNLFSETGMLNIIHFFKDAAEVVRVRLIVNHKSELVGCGFVEFASEDEAKKAVEKKNGECLHDKKIIVEKFNFRARRPRYSIRHDFWYYEHHQPRFGRVCKPNLKLKCRLLPSWFLQYGEKRASGRKI